VSRVVFLDSGPLGALCNVRASPMSVACNRWLRALDDANVRVVIPEIADYEIRRELIRAVRRKNLARLDRLTFQLEYLPLTTAAMRRAAEFWAQARQQGQPTAGDNTIDADMILAGQVIAAGERNYVIATTNPAHLSRFVVAELWSSITP